MALLTFLNKRLEQARIPKASPLTHVEDHDSAIDIQREHFALARTLGAVSAPPVLINLKQVLIDECLSIYPTAAVEKYMDRKGHWAWHPLREQDVSAQVVGRISSHDWPRNYGHTMHSRYEEIVPYPVLLTVQRLIKATNDQVNFYVAALGNHPDPFLGVIAKGDIRRHVYVIERWDKPGFRG